MFLANLFPWVLKALRVPTDSDRTSFVFFLFCSSWYEKNLLNFVTERKKLVSGLAILALPFKLLKPQFIGRILQN